MDGFVMVYDNLAVSLNSVSVIRACILCVV